MTPLRIAVAGATGRMGRALVRLASDAPEVVLVAAATTPEDRLLGQDAGIVAGIGAINVPIRDTVDAPCDVLIEFTLPAGCAAWATWCAEHSVPLVSGTTGLDGDQWAAVAAAAGRVPIVWAPNMSIGINLLLELVGELARRLDPCWDIEICETHHRRKIDAPSGTAQALLNTVCEARQRRPEDVAVFGRVGECGARVLGQVGVHAIRMGELVGEHEIHFTSATESLTLRHRAFSRDTFALGALRAARWVIGKPAGQYDMRAVLTR